MSVHFSRFALNTYQSTPYFQAHIPPDYPLSRVLQKCRAFRRLPPRLRKLSAWSKRWAEVNHFIVDPDIKRWYDDAGNEVDPDTGKKMTDGQIDAQWPDPPDPKLLVKDIPAPDGGFPDPATWKPAEEDDAEYEGPDEVQVLSDIRGHGREHVAKYYGVSLDGIDSDEALAQAILEKLGAPVSP